MPEPSVKRVVAFFDAQNLFHAVKNVFNHMHPDYDPLALANAICVARKGWELSQARLYTGVPDAKDDPFWNHYWNGKLAVLGRQGVHVFRRALRYRMKVVKLPREDKFGAMAGKKHKFLVGEEKGVDVRIAIDIIRLAHLRQYDVALVFSQDQDLSEVADEIRAVAEEQKRWIKIACAFPSGEASRNRRGIDKTDWIEISREMYEECMDLRDYKP